MSLILSLLACVLALGNIAWVARVERRGVTADIPAPDHVRSLSAAKGDLLIVTTEQHFTKAQAAVMREWTEAFTAEHGIKVVVLGGGLKPDVLVSAEQPIRPDSEADLPRVRWIDEIGVRLRAGIAARVRAHPLGPGACPP